MTVNCLALAESTPPSTTTSSRLLLLDLPRPALDAGLSRHRHLNAVACHRAVPRSALCLSRRLAPASRCQFCRCQLLSLPVLSLPVPLPVPLPLPPRFQCLSASQPSRISPLLHFRSVLSPPLFPYVLSPRSISLLSPSRVDLRCALSRRLRARSRLGTLSHVARAIWL